MTPERCTGLAALLLEFRDWCLEQPDVPLAVSYLEDLVDLLGEVRRQLVAEGAQ